MERTELEPDVRTLILIKRHNNIFGTFDKPKPGEAFAFTNGHDPLPEAESEEPFQWEYPLAMPEEWKVKVIKGAS